ncbi:MAG TPA: acetyl-CoA carboxylase, carboxyltransferase subunit beta [Flavobacteriales bacterium]|nr:acetyl-CoA carboxylase, carboxyltransferase subunit beta [Flavobacteriales bacterium]HRO39133.1 acetyl-CoA carboxylase, carboxyltransferase subunit beta [Flavobacteriales bacterium]HRP81163.1 acetyl-CoA carboxylase, carboxyltransferase subunit beta [Flavobacteriales bacterium]HRQ85311.1 acetyl-CoA carboxylase, carboxyltransferase subunit beta [Flavobacteriales bacterium]
MGWFTRVKEGITTSTEEKKETPEGLWYKCPECSEIMTSDDHAQNLWVCAKCQYHERIGSAEYFSILFDEGKFKEIGQNLIAGDPLKFQDTKKYVDRLAQTRKSTGLNDALRAADGKLDKQPVVIACMDFRFIGGSMGSVVGEKIALAADAAMRRKCPLVIISKSGGARMMEAGFSLMQMAKTSAKLSLMAQKRLPFISVLTDPTTGGVTASFAMLGDINIAEPKALVAFAGPRVVRETIGHDLPEGFQTSEFVLEHGFLDLIVERKDLKTTLGRLIQMFRS